jgi:V8-like Glu-specific endopeptidase
MLFNQDKFRQAVSQLDRAAVKEQCENLEKDFYENPAAFTDKDTESIMSDLKGMRFFSLMIRLGDIFLQIGKANFAVRKMYAQALIEERIYTPSISVLNDLIRDTEDKASKEFCEAHGLKGRVFKQLFINAGNPKFPAAKVYLEQAMKAYYTIYEGSRDEKNNTNNEDNQDCLWYGINCVALAARARADGIDLVTDVDIEHDAACILEAIKAKKEEDRDVFELATAIEACVALGKSDEALELAASYAQRSDANAFNYASTLRQLTEVWRLQSDEADPKMKQLIPLIRGALLKREGGALTLEANELKKEMAERGNPTQQVVLGAERFQTYEWYMQGASRCLAVARIGREKSRGIGTGFLMPGGVIHPELKDEVVLLTNSHVVTDNLEEERNALLPGEAIVVFEALDLPKPFYNVKPECFFNSPSNDLDVTVLQFEKADSDEIKTVLENKKIGFQIANRLPDKETGRVYIIGHPAGGTLQLSLLDNALLDYEEKLMHYRAPTVGGSSGSPVFNEYWQLIGIHHAGGESIRRLNRQEGVYSANEGIRIRAIINEIAKKKAEGL